MKRKMIRKKRRKKKEERQTQERNNTDQYDFLRFLCKVNFNNFRMDTETNKTIDNYVLLSFEERDLSFNNKDPKILCQK
jgi:hypothetical protein